ncbi:putative gap junction epsilon-1 protein isoform X1 [Columba livia]|uniref:putative gap junction epsilon-1 protein isoform X1 n=1 Tax=Columba livia TaxID=8932 RepID=UPI0031BAE1C9
MQRKRCPPVQWQRVGGVKTPAPLPFSSSDRPAPGGREGKILRLLSTNCHQDRSLPSPPVASSGRRRRRGAAVRPSLRTRGGQSGHPGEPRAGSSLPWSRRRCPAALVLLAPPLRAEPDPGVRRRPSPRLAPQSRFIPGAGRSRPAAPPASARALAPTPEAPRRILRGGETRSAAPIGTARQTGELSATSGGRRDRLREARRPVSYPGETTAL